MRTKSGHFRKLAFEVFTADPLPVGEQVFIAGSHPVLGQWEPNAFPLTRMDDNLWAGFCEVPSDQIVEYKITRGSWNTEECKIDGQPPWNAILPPGSHMTLRHRVLKWKDRRDALAPCITGNYRIHESFHSRFLRYDRRVIVWLPPYYEQDSSRRYPVLYVQDGEQVFDPLTSTWGQDWQVDENAEEMISKGQIHDLIVVGVYSTSDRYVEYHPAMAGDAYGRFLAEELMPFIAKHYRSQPGTRAAAIAGASLGATIAFHLAWTRPDLFFGAACLSPAFRFGDDTALLDLVRNSAAVPDLKLFLYCGEGDPTEKELMIGTAEMNELLRSRGFKDYQTLLFKKDPDGLHKELAWARQTPVFMKFLFGV